MTTNTNHATCDHPATKAGRAKCRKDRAAKVTDLRVEAGELIYSYYQGADFEEVIYRLMAIFPEVKAAYFDTDQDPEELIALARACKHNL